MYPSSPDRRCAFTRPVDMRLDIGKRVVARVERRSGLCDSTEHVGVLQGSSVPPPPLHPDPDGYLTDRPQKKERYALSTNITTDAADATPKDPSITTATCGTHLITQRRFVPYFAATRFLIPPGAGRRASITTVCFDIPPPRLTADLVP